MPREKGPGHVILCYGVGHSYLRAITISSFTCKFKRPLLGPIIGPIAGRYLTEAKGWRAVFLAFECIGGRPHSFLLHIHKRNIPRGTNSKKGYPPPKRNQNQHLRFKFNKSLVSQNLFLHSITRPMKMLILSPIILLTSLYIGIVYGYFYLLFTTFTLVYEEKYGFSSGSVGLTYVVSLPKLI